MIKEDFVDITIPVPAGEAEAWLARPDTDEAAPAILLFMDAIGLRPQLTAMADRMASWGYTVLAPNLFHRSGTAAETSPDGDLLAPGAREAFFEVAIPRIGELTTELALGDVQAYLDRLGAEPGVLADRIGVVGYCMGVRHALRAAGDHPDRVRAVGGFHGGGLVTEDPDSPHLSLATASASVLLRHADQDKSMTPDQMQVITETAARAGVELDQQVYAGAVHGYTMADTPMYSEADAERHFVDLRQHFAAHL